MGMLLSRHYADNGNGDSNKNKNTAKGVTKTVAPKAEVKEDKSVVTGTDTKKTAKVSVDEIKAMNGNKARKLAKELGVDNPEELTLGELKAVLCDKVKL